MAGGKVLRRPAGRRPGAPAAAASAGPARAGRSRSPRAVLRRPAARGAAEGLDGIKAYVVSLDRRPDRWARCEAMLKAEAPWLEYERFPASDGAKMAIPASQVCESWNTRKNAHFSCDYDEWVYDEPGSELNGVHWRWPKEEPEEDDAEWKFDKDDASGVLTQISTGKTWKMKLEFAERFRNPGQIKEMSPGERGCAHSHRRIWEVAAGRTRPTLVLEDDVQFVFERSDPSLGTFGGALLRERLEKALREAPSDFDVLYLGWAGWRGGNFYELEKEDSGKTIRRAQYVYTTVAYVISPKAARRLLSISTPIDQPVDNFMAWEASQGNLKSFVILDEGDSDDLWAGGIVDQFDFVGDSDVKKSDGARAVVFTPESPAGPAVTPEKLAAGPGESPPKVDAPKGDASENVLAKGDGLLGKLSETAGLLRKAFQAHVS